MRRGLVAVLAVVSLSGCATLLARDRIEQIGMRSQGRYLPVDAKDFPGGDAGHGTPTTAGSRLLADAYLSDEGVQAFVRANGLPDAAAVDVHHRNGVMLAYGARATVYVFEGQPLPVAQRALSEDELDQVVPDRRLAKMAELLRAYLDKQARVVHVGRRVVRTLPPAPGKPAGEYYGFLTLPITPLSARLFSQAADADGRIVAWVDPDGPAAGRLQAGDRLTEINGVQIAVREKSGMKDEGPIAVALVRGGAASEVHLTPDALPRKLVLVALLQDEPNAIAVEGGVAVTTGLIDLLPSDDALAFVLGHELAHISEGHVEKKITPGSVLKGIVTATVLVPANIALPGSGELLGAAIQGVQNRFNRDQERDADRLGVRYAQAAGYDPRAAIGFMELMAEKAPVGSVAQFLDVHPPYPERTELLRAEVAAVAQHQPAD